MKEILIVLASTLIPSVATLITVIFTQLGKYKKTLIIAQKNTQELHEKIQFLEAQRSSLINRVTELENQLLKLKKGDKY